VSDRSGLACEIWKARRIAGSHVPSGTVIGSNECSSQQTQLRHHHMYTANLYLNLLMPNDDYSGRTAPLTSKCCILYIYSTNIGTQYFKHGIYSPFFPLQNAFGFIILTYLVPVLFTFYIQCVLKFKKIIPAPKG